MCVYVASQIFNGRGTGSPSLGRFCGNQLPSSVPSSFSSYLTVQFTSNSDGQTSTGFTLNFTQAQFNCNETIELSEDRPSVNITSPNYPNAYRNNIDCTWSVHAPANHIVQLQFIGNVFRIESSTRL